jgi:hypothetical protein
MAQSFIMTVGQRLLAIAPSRDAARTAAEFIAEHLPENHEVVLGEDAIHAALDGDAVAFSLAIAPEAAPQPDELEALRELQEQPELRETIPLEDLRAKLGL